VSALNSTPTKYSHPLNCLLSKSEKHFSVAIPNLLNTYRNRQMTTLSWWCVVSVNGRLDVNVALNRPSYQVGGNSNAARANDGDMATRNPFCSITTQVTHPWWAVDLVVALYVWGVKLTNRNGHGTYGSSSTQTFSQPSLSVQCNTLHGTEYKITCGVCVCGRARVTRDEERVLPVDWTEKRLCR